MPYGARKSFERWKDGCYHRFAFKGNYRSHDLGSREEEMRFVRGTTLLLSWQIGLRTMRRIRTHGCVYSFRLDACIWKRRHRCRMRHVRVHVPDLCEPRPLTSRLLINARTFDILTNLKLCSSLSSSETSILNKDRPLIWIEKKIFKWGEPLWWLLWWKWNINDWCAADIFRLHDF